MCELKNVEKMFIIRYFFDNTNEFIKFLKNRDNFTKIIECFIKPENKIRNNLSNDSLLELVFCQTYLNISKSSFLDFLMALFSFQEIINSLPENNSKDSVDVVESIELLYIYEQDDRAFKDYQETVSKTRLNQIIKQIYPFEKKVKDNYEYNLNLNKVIKEYYKVITLNSFDLAIEDSINSQEIYLSEHIYIDFQIFIREQAINNIEQYKVLLLDIFDNKNYNSEGKLKWVPLLCRSNIVFTTQIYAAKLREAVSEYIFILGMREAIKKNNDSNMIIASNFKDISKLSHTLDYIQKMVLLNDTEFRYIFFYIIEKKCNASKAEMTFIINKLQGFKNKTYKNMSLHTFQFL